MSKQTEVAMELYGGPLDGAPMVLPLLPAGQDTYLLKVRETKEIIAYEWANYTTSEGRWVLKFLKRIGTQGIQKP